LVQVVLPDVIARENSMRGTRRIGDRVCVEMTRSEAAGWLRNPAWRALNAELAAELLKDEPA